MTLIIILIILFLIWLIFGNRIRQWLARLVANRTEDYIRKATGMPPRPGSREARRRQRATDEASRQGKTQGASANYSRDSSAGRSSRRRRTNRVDPNEPLIPKEYAEDVEFVETISYSQTTIGISESDSRHTVYHESQVSDVEWEEIKIKKKR